MTRTTNIDCPSGQRLQVQMSKEDGILFLRFYEEGKDIPKSVVYWNANTPNKLEVNRQEIEVL